ncbi:hypothetical protein L218DRAFT_958519 [Marasmius fiardii PR-910]|nr:hypothetical protein L218DRAFT_958519 [Marasmius fiardii PR-910]
MIHDLVTYCKGHSRDELARIQCPAKAAYGTKDVAYPLEYTERFVQELRDAGVDSTLITVRNASTTGSTDLVVVIAESSGSGSSLLPPTPNEVASPWNKLLRDAGWQNEDEDDQDLIHHYECSLRQFSEWLIITETFRT